MPNQASQPFPGPISISGFQSISGTCSEKTGVCLSIGNLTKALNLLHVPAVGLPLDFSLYYNAQTGWSNTYQQYLDIQREAYTIYIPTPTPHYATEIRIVQIVFYADGGQQFTFVPTIPVSSDWPLLANSRFITATLSGEDSGFLTGGGGLDDPTPDWTLTFPNGAYFTFTDNVNTFSDSGYDSQAPLTSMVDAYGNTLTLAYNDDGQLTSVTEPTGRQITFGYTEGYLSTVTDPRENAISLTWSGVNLTQVMGPEGCCFTYSYTDSLLTSSTDGNGHTWTYSYNTSHQVTGITSPESISIAYACKPAL